MNKCPICNIELTSYDDGTDAWSECDGCYQYMETFTDGAITIRIGCFIAVIFYDDTQEKKDEIVSHIFKVAEIYKKELEEKNDG